MGDYVLSCCSTADLTKEHFAARGIYYVCIHYELDGVEHPDDLGESIPFPDFYKAIEDGAMTKTSQVNTDQYIAHFTPFLEAGKDIIHVCLSSGISGTINSAKSAAELLKEKFPERKIYIIDSLGASSGYGLLMDYAADKRDEGMNVDECARWIEEHKLNLHHWFFSTTLKYFVRGGRISKTAGVFGGLLDICPLMNMDNLGRLIPRYKIRTKKKVINAIVNKMEECADDGINYSGKCYISQAGCYDDARAVADLIEERFKKLNGKVEIYYVGTTIGSHTGPGTVALFFMGSRRID